MRVPDHSVAGTDPDLFIWWDTNMFPALWTLSIFTKQGAEMGDGWTSGAILLVRFWVESCLVVACRLACLCGMVYFLSCSFDYFFFQFTSSEEVKHSDGCFFFFFGPVSVIKAALCLAENLYPQWLTLNTILSPRIWIWWLWFRRTSQLTGQQDKPLWRYTRVWSGNYFTYALV